MSPIRIPHAHEVFTHSYNRLPGAMKYPLVGLTISVTGDFGPRRSHQILKRWILREGGQFSWTVTNQVTHLVCSKADYRNRAPMGSNPYGKTVMCVRLLTLPSVLQAARLQSIAIVTSDWLEGKTFLRLIHIRTNSDGWFDQTL